MGNKSEKGGPLISAFSLLNLVTAYRKAKVDLFYASNPRRLDLVAFEVDLETHLDTLLGNLLSDDESWVTAPGFVGGFTFEPKGVRPPKDVPGTFWSAPAEAWRHKTERDEERPVARFRLMSRCSIPFHVLSTLWMLEVGTQLDGRLSANAHGNRLRQALFGGPNHLGVGSFKSWKPAYREWRDNGMTAMRDALAQDQAVISLTADVTAFYHHLDPKFLLDNNYLEGVLGVVLTTEQLKLTRLFVSALYAWSNQVADALDGDHRGLPVGLPASAVVANLALAELDTIVEALNPLYYGRYVDDILLVINDSGEFNDQPDLWRWLVSQSRGLLTTRPLPEGERYGISDQAIRFVPPYLASSLVAFENDKNKTFHLSGHGGTTMIEAIAATIRERASEWRSMATVPDDVVDIGATIASVLNIDGEAAATLRDSERVSARRHGFSLQLRDIELLERNLQPSSWKRERRAFVEATCTHVLSLPAFFELSSYLPRLIALAAACKDADALNMIRAALADVVGEVSRTCDVQVAALAHPTLAADNEEPNRPQERLDDPRRLLVLNTWAEHLVQSLLEGIAAGWRGSMTANQHTKIFPPLTDFSNSTITALPDTDTLQRWHSRMAQRDLAHRPYRWWVLRLPTADRVTAAVTPNVPLPGDVATAADNLIELLPVQRRLPFRFRIGGRSDAGVVFATRPPTLDELYLHAPSQDPARYGVLDEETVHRILYGLRGQIASPLPTVENRTDWPTVIHIPGRSPDGPVRIGLAMVDNSEDDLIAAALGKPNLSVRRLRRLQRLLDGVAKQEHRPKYVMLPELSVPVDFFVELAKGLNRSGIGLIAGVEYQQTKRGGVANQVWAAVPSGGPNSQLVIYPQDKQRPAIPELTLFSKHGITLDPVIKYDVPPVIEHGDFRFAFLICSEFTNIRNRAHLRGAVDALLVPEWNQDLHWFEALIEASTHDLHTYVAQSNTLGFGDTRLRGPKSKPFARDIVRLQGGLDDYVVTGEIDYEYLRIVQTLYEDGKAVPALPDKKDAAKALKPTPDGFHIDPDRRIETP